MQPPPPKADPFVVLGLERRFAVEPDTVESAWRAVSRAVHPDRWAGKSAVFRRMSLQWTASVNEAKRILSDGWREPGTWPRAWPALLSVADLSPMETSSRRSSTFR